jgi:hypothetical protein|tara:strand:+ start:411 stop:710 length:300 start_codon:yes stop_codon:yes gene_type:complete
MNKIKKPQSAYYFYVECWETMSPDERAPFNQKAAEDKKRHDKEVYLEKKKNRSKIGHGVVYSTRNAKKRKERIFKQYKRRRGNPARSNRSLFSMKDMKA